MEEEGDYLVEELDGGGGQNQQKEQRKRTIGVGLSIMGWIQLEIWFSQRNFLLDICLG